MPAHSSKIQLLGTAFLCGIGFTMSLFITLLAFSDNANFQAQAKIGILIGSLIAGLVVYALLRRARLSEDQSSRDNFPGELHVSTRSPKRTSDFH